jgi:hypothetical protein
MAKRWFLSWLIAVTDIRVVAGVILLVDAALIALFAMLQAENCL